LTIVMLMSNTIQAAPPPRVRAISADSHRALPGWCEKSSLGNRISMTRHFRPYRGVACGKSTVARYFQDLGAHHRRRPCRARVDRARPRRYQESSITSGKRSSIAGPRRPEEIGTRVFADPQQLRQLTPSSIRASSRACRSRRRTTKAKPHAVVMSTRR